MIITCEKCSTRFNLDDSLLQKDGSKVRCSVCKNIFMAYSEPEDDNAALIAPSGLSLETEPDEISVSEADLDDEFGPGQVDEDGDDFSLENNDFSLEDDGLMLEDDSLAMEEEVFSIDDDQPLADDEDLQAPGEDSSFSLEDDSLEIEDNDLTMEDDGLTLEDNSLSVEEDVFSIDDDQPLADDEDLQAPEEELTLEVNELSMADDTDDDDLSLEAEEFEIDVVEDGEVSFDEPEESPALEMERPGLPGLESGDEEGDDDAFDGIEFEPLEDDLSGTEPESLEIETPDILETESSGDDEDAFELELELESGEDDGDALPENDALTGAEDEEFELEFDIEEEADETPALEFDATAESPDEPELSAQETPEEDFSSYDTVLEQDAEPGTDQEEDAGEASIMPPPLPPQDEPSEEAPEDDETLLTPPPARRRRRKKKSSVSAPVMILMLLFLLIAGAYVASLMTGYQIPYLSDIEIPGVTEVLKSKAPVREESKPAPNDPSTNGRFVTNKNAGALFVITGQVDNLAEGKVSQIKVTGSLFTEGKVEARKKEVYCGNIIPEETLKNGAIEEIDKALKTATGTHNANMNIKPGASVPFMIVFSELPDKLQNFTVKVSGFKENKKQ